MKVTYVALHQGHAQRTTRSREVNFAVFLNNEHSLKIDRLVGWAKSRRGAEKMARDASRFNRGRTTIVNATAEQSA